MCLEQLFDFSNYKALLHDIARGVVDIPEREEWIKHIGVAELEKVFAELAYIMWNKHREVIYPQEMIIIPRYPFSKKPLLPTWANLQNKDASDPEIAVLKDRASKLGTLINAGFILKNFVLIDIDLDIRDESATEEVEKICDIKTNRGYHILIYSPKYEAYEFSFKNSKGFKIVIKTEHGKIELISGKGYLGSYPPQARFLDFTGGKVNVRRYKEVSTEAKIAFASADLTPLEVTPQDVEERINKVLHILGVKDRVTVKALEKQSNEVISIDIVDAGPGVTSRFNKAPLPILGRLSFAEFKSLLSSVDVEGKIPTCIKNSLFGNIRKGYRYFHLRFLLAILPFFITLDKIGIKELVKDFAMRTDSKRSEVREWTYYTKYFTARVYMNDQEAVAPSKLGVPSESWSTFETLRYCDTCTLKDQCLKLSLKQRRKLLVDYLAEILYTKV